MVCVAKGSPGSQWSGVSSQPKETFRGARSMCSDATGAGASGVLDMASMY